MVNILRPGLPEAAKEVCDMLRGLFRNKSTQRGLNWGGWKWLTDWACWTEDLVARSSTQTAHAQGRESVQSIGGGDTCN